jgi:hypothetical protein
MGFSEYSIERVGREFAGAKLGDPRLARRASAVATALARKPSAPLPRALGTSAALEGAYRLMNNQRVTFDLLQQAHADETARRARETSAVLVLHDTTDATFPDHDPDEIGYLPTGKAGFLFHVSLVLDASRWRDAIGVIHGETIHRPQRSKRTGKKKASGRESVIDAARESARWWRGVEAAGQRLQGCNEVIHVADRESDSYELMHRCLESGHRFVFRARVAERRGRIADGDVSTWSTVKAIADASEGVLQREVVLSRRAKKSAPGMNRGNPPRAGRNAALCFSASRVELPRPQYLQAPFPKTLAVNLVHVIERCPPESESPVQWLLYTTEPIDTPEQVARIVDIYRTRWTIEEFNAALKTGCAYEARQFESRHALLNMLALSLPVACELLALRSRARDCPDAPATTVLRWSQIEVLRTMGPTKLSDSPSAREALLAVAALGGHLKNNGEPGWKILMRGMRDLLDYEAAWLAGRQSVGARDQQTNVRGDL